MYLFVLNIEIEVIRKDYFKFSWDWFFLKNNLVFFIDYLFWFEIVI